MRIRVAAGDDAETLVELISGFRDHLGVARPSAEELRAYLPTALTDASTEFCLAEAADGEPLGYTQSRYFASVWASAPEAHLEDLFVVESARRQGLGRRLLDHAIARAATREAVSIGLHTNENNEPAQAFYRRAGFRPQTEPRWQGGREVYWARPIELP